MERIESRDRTSDVVTLSVAAGETSPLTGVALSLPCHEGVVDCDDFVKGEAKAWQEELMQTIAKMKLLNCPRDIVMRFFELLMIVVVGLGMRRRPSANDVHAFVMSFEVAAIFHFPSAKTANASR